MKEERFKKYWPKPHWIVAVCGELIQIAKEDREMTNPTPQTNKRITNEKNQNHKS